jgi:hypothetical protein
VYVCAIYVYGHVIDLAKMRVSCSYLGIHGSGVLMNTSMHWAVAWLKLCLLMNRMYHTNCMHITCNKPQAIKRTQILCICSVEVRICSVTPFYD